MKKLLLSTVMLLFVLHQANAEDRTVENIREHTPKVGLMAMIQSTQFDIGVPVWISPSAIVGPSLSLVYMEGLGTDLGLGFFFKSYGDEVVSDIATYFAMRGGVIVAFPDGNADNSIDLVVGTGYGVDYFPHEKVSLGVEAQLNLTKASDNSGRFVLPGGVNLNTATVIALSIFF